MIPEQSFRAYDKKADRIISAEELAGTLVFLSPRGRFYTIGAATVGMPKGKCMIPLDDLIYLPSKPDRPRDQCIRLRVKGFGYREIQRRLKLNSPSQVAWYLKRYLDSAFAKPTSSP